MMALLVLGVVAASGCAYGEVRQVIRAQFASEFNCSEVQLHKRDSWYAQDNPNQFKVTGCGQTRTYTCDKDVGLVSYDKPACKFVNDDADAPGADKPQTNPVTEPMPDNGDSAPAADDEPSSSSSSAGDDSSADSSSSDGLDSSADITSDSSSSDKKVGGKAKASGGIKVGGHK